VLTIAANFARCNDQPTFGYADLCHPASATSSNCTAAVMLGDARTETAMIITCPACKTRYTVDDATIGADGRRVRCADCGHVWHYSAEAAAIQEAIAEVTAQVGPATDRPAASIPSPAVPLPTEILRAEPRIEAQPPPAGPAAMPRPSVHVELPAAARRRRARIWGLLLTIILVGVVLAAVFAREGIMRMWPATMPVYAALQLIDSSGAGVDVKVTPTRTSASLVIDGEVVNTASTARLVRRMRVSLQDGSKNEVDFRVITPPVVALLPGGTARFNTVFERPSSTATDVAVTFVTQ
jgi:predicted Zn finger-like uncharacterized protein